MRKSPEKRLGFGEADALEIKKQKFFEVNRLGPLVLSKLRLLIVLLFRI